MNADQRDRCERVGRRQHTACYCLTCLTPAAKDARAGSSAGSGPTCDPLGFRLAMGDRCDLPVQSVTVALRSAHSGGNLKVLLADFQPTRGVTAPILPGPLTMIKKLVKYAHAKMQRIDRDALVYAVEHSGKVKIRCKSERCKPEASDTEPGK